MQCLVNPYEFTRIPSSNSSRHRIHCGLFTILHMVVSIVRRYPNSWMIYVRDPNLKCMILSGVPLWLRKPSYLDCHHQPSLTCIFELPQLPWKMAVFLLAPPRTHRGPPGVHTLGAIALWALCLGTKTWFYHGETEEIYHILMGSSSGPYADPLVQRIWRN